MQTNTINVKIFNIEKELQLLKDQKEKLVDLASRIKKTRDELIESQLSGKTYDASIKNNNLLVNKIDARVQTINVLISKLEESCQIYNNCYSTINKSVSGGK